MARTVGIGNQDFETVRREGYFYIDKTDFIRQWWESGDGVTLITRPRRFGKTLNMSMLEKFFSVAYKDRGDLFQGLKIWEDGKYREPMLMDFGQILLLLPKACLILHLKLTLIWNVQL